MAGSVANTPLSGRAPSDRGVETAGDETDATSAIAAGVSEGIAFWFAGSVTADDQINASDWSGSEGPSESSLTCGARADALVVSPESETDGGRYTLIASLSPRELAPDSAR